MMRKLPLILTPVLLVAFSCAKEDNGAIAGDSSASSAEIIDFGGDGIDDSSIILYVDGSLDTAALRACGITGVRPVFTSTPGKEDLERKFNLDKWFEASLEEGADPRAVAGAVSVVPEIKRIQLNYIMEPASDGKVYPYEGPVAAPATKGPNTPIFNDPSLGDQWHYINSGSKSYAKDAYAGADINVKDVWTNLTTGDNSIIVAVVDQGVKYTHPDLAANMWTGPNGEHGYNFVDNGAIVWDGGEDSSHGTHCAGTIAAVNNNGIGVSGVAGGSGKGDGVRIMSCQIFNEKRGGSSTIVSKAIKYAADNGASIISCSFGYPGGTYRSDKAYRDGNGGANALEAAAIQYFEATRNNAVLDGGIAIFASGNDGDPYATYPGALNDIISVSSFGPDYLPAYYTNYGPGCNIVAPGGEAYHVNTAGNSLLRGMVLSTVPSENEDGADYGYMQGTSMACPHVSGIAALALSYAKKIGKTFTVREFKEMLVTSANDFDTRLQGTKDLYNRTPIELSKYRHMMGTGSIDTWKLMMKIEGVPCLIAETGSNQWLDISSYFGTSSVNLTYLDVEIVRGAESVAFAEEPYVQYGRLFVHPTKIGSCKIKITAVGGGIAVGGDDAIGGMEVSQVVSVISRSDNNKNGGWL